MVSGSEQTTFKSPNPVTLGLPIAVDPHSDTFPPGSPVDSGLQWLVDFKAAVAVGMGIQISLRPDQRKNGFDRIFVYGLRTREQTGSGTLGNLLDAHHYTDGFALVPQGSNTNNSADGSSAFSRKDPQYAVSFAVERSGPLIQTPQNQPEVDGNRFATLLGFDASKMTNVQYSPCTGVQNGRDMLVALWSATMGYFLNQVMSPVFSADEITAARQYALGYAIPRGPIPAFRMGATPYGVLPVTALSQYQFNPDNGGTRNEQLFVEFLRQLWPTWLESSVHAPHLERTGDPDAQLGLILGMDASSTSFRGRPVFGADFLWNYMGFIGTSPQEKSNWWAQQLQPGRTLLDSYGLQSLDPRLIHMSAAHDSFPVFAPTVTGVPVSETDPLPADAAVTDSQGKTTKVNYIQWLQQASVSDIRADNYTGPKPAALLYKILRQSLVLEYAGIAYTGEIAANRLDQSQTREAELINMGNFQTQAATKQSSSASVGVWDVLDRYVDPSAVTKQKWSDYLVSIAPQAGSPYPDLNDLYASVARLALLPTAELERLLTETLDACSHRLDVWATSVATAILRRTRREFRNVYLGAYAWVEDVRPEPSRVPVRGNELAASQALDAARAKVIGSGYVPPPKPLEPQADNGGFIYAPSQDQAAVAAILRSGYMSHIGTGDQDSLSIDLSSERVQGALLLLDGVRQGQSVNALLGYIFEAGLHKLSLDKYIQPFRDCFPMAANQLTASDASAENVAASNVVDGQALKAASDAYRFQVGQTWPVGAPQPCPGLPDPGNSSDQNAVVSLLQQMNAYADALADLSISEAIFQTVRGNFERAGGLLAAISKGQPPPEPQVINTPRGGLDITHRSALLFVGSPPPNTWTSGTPRARALAEPWLDAWLSEILPQPSASVTCNVTIHDPKTGDQTVSVNLAQLNLAPLDCIAMAEGSMGGDYRSELEDRILYQAGVPPTATGSISYPPSTGSALSFPDMLYLWKTFRLLINGARPLVAQDFSLPSQKVADGNAPANFAALLTRAKAALNALQNDLASLIASVQSQPAQLPQALLNCSFYGLVGSVPLSNTATDARLADQATYVLNALGDRSTKAATLINNPAAGSSDLMSALALIFGKDFVVLPTFAPPDPQSLGAAFAQSDSLVASDRTAPNRWLSQLTYVRPAMARLDTALGLADIASQGTALPPKLWLGQLPLMKNDQWLGLPWAPASPPANGRVAFACFSVGDPSSTSASAYTGLMIDQWIDRVPSPEEKAAVTFHYEEPKARPPQCLLLAVCPDKRETWDDSIVTAILAETLELTKIRTVDLSSIEKVGQVLPALYFPFNLRGDTPTIFIL
jgi:hypothetical protein